MVSTSPPCHLKPVRVALVQLGQTSTKKAFNLDHARSAVLRAAKNGPEGGADLVVLPECFNSPYGVDFFPTYAETLPGLYKAVKESGTATAADGKRAWEVDNCENAHAIELSEQVLEASESVRMLSELAKEANIVLVGGSIPEREGSTGDLYNTSCVFDKQGRIVAMHRKLHLFDIDVPGKMTFQESKTLTGGNQVTVFDCGTFQRLTRIRAVRAGDLLRYALPRERHDRRASRRKCDGVPRRIQHDYRTARMGAAASCACRRQPNVHDGLLAGAAEGGLPCMGPQHGRRSDLGRDCDV